MSQKMLIMAPRLPDLSGNRSARNFLARIQGLARSYEVYFLFVQSMFPREDTMRLFEKAGIRTVPFSALKQQKAASLEKQLEQATGVGRFDLILFSTHYTAKYYLPYLAGAARDSVVVIDACSSPYVFEMRHARESRELENRMAAVKSAELSKMKEIAVYHHADAVLVDAEADRETLAGEIPFVDVRVLPECTGTGAKEHDEQLCAVFSSFRKKSPAACTPENTPVTKADLGDPASRIAAFNDALRRVDGEFSLIIPSDATFPPQCFAPLLSCIQSNPRYGIVVPTSNLDIEWGVDKNRMEEEFLRKHYLMNFGYWREIRQISGGGLLVRREMRDRIGLLDERFGTMQYALFDYCLKAFQAGYTAVLANESFIFYPGPVTEDERELKRDHALLYRKWCDAGTEYLEGLGGEAERPFLPGACHAS